MGEGGNHHRSKKRQWIMVLVVVFIVLAGGAYVFASRSPKPTYITTTASIGSLQKTVDASGTIRSKTEVVLSFEASGEVADVLVQKGAEVHVGDPLVRLDAQVAEAALVSAKESVRIAEAKLAEKLAGSRSESVDVARSHVATAKANEEAARVAAANATIDAERSVAVAEEVVRQSMATLASAKEAEQTLLVVQKEYLASAWQDIASGLRSETIAVRTALSEADRVLGIENKTGNDDFEFILSAQDAQAKTSAENAFREAALARGRAEQVVYGLSVRTPTGDIEKTIPVVDEALSLAETTLLETRRVLDATTADVDGFTKSDLATLKAAIDSARTLLQTEHVRLTSSIQTKDTLLASQAQEASAAHRAVIDAEAALSRAMADNEQTKSAKQAAILTAEATLAIRSEERASAEASLAEVLSAPRSVEVQALQAEVRRAASDVDAATEKLHALTLVAPIDGVVGQLDVEVGEVVQAGKQVGTIQTTEELFEVVLDVSESDIALLEIGDEGMLTLDAFSRALPLTGHVVRIDPAEKVIEGVTYYEVGMALQETPAGLKPGLSVDATIVVESRTGVVGIPERAIFTEQGASFVRLLQEGGGVEERAVQVGLHADAGRVEVVGLNEGEVVILSTKSP